MIDINKKYRTRDGRKARIYATDGEQGKLVHGAVKHKEHGWQSMLWFADGHYDHGGIIQHPYDLIEVRPRHKRTVWVNVYRDDLDAYISREQAEDEQDTDRIACIKVELDFEEGQGLCLTS